jgi:formylmethanofuran dehydrogenase subunit E
MSDDADWSQKCFDCERAVGRRNLQPHPVHVDNEDGVGYEVVDVPLCRACRLKRIPTHECERCGEEWADVTSTVECCQHCEGRPMPDGGRVDGEEEPLQEPPRDARYCPSCGESLPPDAVTLYGDRTMDRYRASFVCPGCAYSGEIIRDGGLDDLSMNLVKGGAYELG